MIEGTYDIALDTPKHHKRGTLALKSNGERIAARLKLGDDVDLEFAGTCADKDFDFKGSGEFPSLGQVEYAAHGTAWGNSIDVQCESSIGKITIFGTRLSTAAGEFRSSHDYIMSASKAEFDDNEGTMYSGLYADGG
jgi:hypothetical protein